MNIEHPGLEYQNQELFFDNASLTGLADKYSTPLYVYSSNLIQENIHSYQQGLKNRQHLLCYSVKSNSNLSILKLVKNTGCGADIVSGGELFRCIKAQIPPDTIVFSGVGKTNQEIEQAISCGLMLFSVESEQELYAINKIAQDQQKKVQISLRINPDVDAKTHPYISTGLTENKFGISQELVPKIFQTINESKWMIPAGVGFHIGSQLTSLDGYKEAAQKLAPLIKDLLQNGIKLKYIDCGGGLGIQYNSETPPSINDYSNLIDKELPFKDQILLFEPGRSIVGNAGILITKVLYTKTNKKKHFTIVDAAMNDIIRPALYDGYHKIFPISKVPGLKQIITDIVGPICETGDFIARNRAIQPPNQGALLAVLSAGAYCFSMSSNYNSRPRAAELLINEDLEIKIIRKRETHDNLIEQEIDCL